MCSPFALLAGNGWPLPEPTCPWWTIHPGGVDKKRAAPRGRPREICAGEWKNAVGITLAYWIAALIIPIFHKMSMYNFCRKAANG